jgi:2-oxoisovalerate dehydrogenase E1 component alpha subunit
MVQLIEGGRKATKELDLSDSDLKALFEYMLLTRAIDSRLINLQRQGRIGFYLASTGQEATSVGAGYALDPQDWIFPHYRDPGTALVRGVTVREMVNQCYGNSLDNVKGRQMPVHYSWKDKNLVSISSPLATQIIQAQGAAHAAKIKGDKIVVLTTFGDGSTSEGDFHIAANMAGVYKTPLVMVCENNQWAISVPLKYQTASESFAIKAVAYGIPGVKVDGNDVLAVYKVVKEAVDRARRGEGPTLIEAYTFRMSSHSTSDDNTRYTPAAMFEEWKKKDPIDRYRKFLQGVGLWNEAWEKKHVDEAQRLVDEAIKEAEAVGPPPTESIFEDVYEEAPAALRSQRDEFIRFQNERGG